MIYCKVSIPKIEKTIPPGYTLLPNLKATLERVFDGTPNSNGPQALIINYVWAGSTPDGYYSQPIMWKGLAFALATVTHNLLWQYNTTSRSECDYFAEVGSGMLITNESWVAGAQWLCYAVLFCILAHIMWISVLYPFSDEADIVLCSMGNPLRFAHDMGASGRTIFSERGLETHDDDFLAKRGDTVVRYGVKMSSIDQGLYKIGYGLKKSVVPIKKLIRKEVREARANGASTGVMSQRKMH